MDLQLTGTLAVPVMHPGLVETERMPQLVADRAAATGRNRGVIHY